MCAFFVLHNIIQFRLRGKPSKARLQKETKAHTGFILLFLYILIYLGIQQSPPLTCKTGSATGGRGPSLQPSHSISHFLSSYTVPRTLTLSLLFSLQNSNLMLIVPPLVIVQSTEFKPYAHFTTSHHCHSVCRFFISHYQFS